MSRYGWFRPYVPVAERRARALKKMAQLRKKGLDVQPVQIEGRTIARTFWGKAWCDHLESFSDYANRLPRGRTYVRNGSVCHLEIAKGRIDAMVSGSTLYKVRIAIQTLKPAKWKSVRQRCAGQIGSLLELLQGRFAKNVMSIVTNRDNGLFPMPGEIRLGCSCPDWAVMCKHVAAVLYGVGARLDEKPELLFLLRGVDHEELISAPVNVPAATAPKGRRRIAEDALADVFGIEMSPEEAPAAPKAATRRKKSAPAKTPKDIQKQSPKAPAKKKTKSPAPKRAKQPAPLTGKTVARMRAKLGMSRSAFARLLNVSPPTIANWESQPGRLKLHARTLAALQKIE